MLNVLIIEDEEAAIRGLKKMILEQLPGVHFLSPLGSIRSSIEWFKNNPSPDLVFMDIQLEDGQSFEIFKSVKIDAPIIFVTAYDQYALEAFSVNSIDYLLKPVKKEDLQRALEKFNQRKPINTQQVNLEKLLASLQAPTVAYKQRFAVKYGEHLKTIETADAAYFYTENKVNFLVTNDNKRYFIDYNLDNLEGMLDPKKFFRINRQFIISFHSISEMFSYSKSRVLIKLNPTSKIETIVSAERSGSFKAWLDDN